MNTSVVKADGKRFGATPIRLKNGTVCYTKPIRYPTYIINELKKIRYEQNLDTMSEAIFYCIENHESQGMISSDKITPTKDTLTSLTIRFRDKHFDYVEKVCEAKKLSKFTHGVVYTIYEYLLAEERL